MLLEKLEQSSALLINHCLTFKGSSWQMCSNLPSFFMTVCNPTAQSVCVLACLLLAPSSPVVSVCLCVPVPPWHLSMVRCSALVRWEGGKTRVTSGLSLWSMAEVNDLQSFKVQQGNLYKEGCGHAACSGSYKSDLSCFAGWVLRLVVWGRVAWVGSGVILGVSPGHASDCCLIVFKPVFCVVPRHAAMAMQHRKLFILFYFLIQARASSFSKWLTDWGLSLAGYWPSYNIPFHEKIYNLSGYASYVVKYGMDFSYELAPRAKIFRRDQGKVTNLESMKYIMRYNSKTHVCVLWSWS